MNKENIEVRIKEIERQMENPRFWEDKNRAQLIVKEYQSLKIKSDGDGYESGGAVMTIFSGAGGDDSEDFSAMLLHMYKKYFERQGWIFFIVHQNQNDHGGYRNVTVEIHGNGVYGAIKNESGVHRLVRISPFNANKKRHTSFSMVEVIPKFEEQGKSDIKLKDDDLKIEFSRSSGPGGQNVNKRETAVRIVHIPTNLSAHVDEERSQVANKDKALSILKAKIFRALEEKRVSEEEGMYISKTTQVQWGNQIRSYVLHPYKLVKDHRTMVETSNVDAVLDEGELDKFVEAEKKI